MTSSAKNTVPLSVEIYTRPPPLSHRLRAGGVPHGRRSRPSGSPYVLLDLTVYRVSTLGSPGTDRGPRGFPGRRPQKRRQGVYRAVPVPATLLDALDLVHGLRDRATRTQLWTWSLKTASTRVIEIVARAGIAGPQASPTGLRHGFGVACIAKGIPLNLVQRWLSHAQLSTTAIYADAVGEEERQIAARLWA